MLMVSIEWKTGASHGGRRQRKHWGRRTDVSILMQALWGAGRTVVLHMHIQGSGYRRTRGMLRERQAEKTRRAPFKPPAPLSALG